MANGPAKRTDLTNGSLASHLWGLWWPMIAGVLGVMSVQVVDAYFLGQLGADPLAAIGFAGPVTFVVISLAIGLGAGAVSVVSRAAGRGNDEELRDLANASVLLALIIVATASFLGIIFAEPLFRFMGAQDRLMPDILGYMRIWFAGLVFLVVPMVASNILRATGDSVSPMLLMTSAAIINAVLDPIFIFGWGPIPRMEVEGAALASLVARAVSLVPALILLFGIRKILSWRLPPGQRLWRAWKQVLYVGLPASFSNMINPLGMTISTGIIAAAGAAAVAGYSSVGTRVEMFALVPLFALSAAIGPLTGQNLAAGHMDRVRTAMRLAFAGAAIWGSLIALCFLISSGFLAQAFTDDVTARRWAELYLLIVPASGVGYGFVMVTAAGFNAMGHPWPGLFLTALRSFGLYVPGVWFGTQFGSALGVAIAIAAANVLSGLLALAYAEWATHSRRYLLADPPSQPAQ
jgi:putative MATE family efflux protein